MLRLSMNTGLDSFSKVYVWLVAAQLSSLNLLAFLLLPTAGDMVQIQRVNLCLRNTSYQKMAKRDSLKLL